MRKMSELEKRLRQKHEDKKAIAYPNSQLFSYLMLMIDRPKSFNMFERKAILTEAANRIVKPENHI